MSAWKRPLIEISNWTAAFAGSKILLSRIYF
jgi:hypothetical protein